MGAGQSSMAFWRENVIRAVGVNASIIAQDKAFMLFLLCSGIGGTSVMVRDYLSLKKLITKHPSMVAAEQKKKLERESGKKDNVNRRFYTQLLYLLRICIPSTKSYEVILLVVQFFLLVMRTLVTVKLTKMNVQFLTQAIAQASWTTWVNWLVNFFYWMVVGTGVNSGLRYVESHIAISFRRRLTLKAHEMYLKGDHLYKCNILADDSNLTNLDQRIVKDIDAFSRISAKMYGHSFKPVLEFILTLFEATKDIGLIRPFALFFITGASGFLLRPFAPKINKIVEEEAELEGQFVRAHNRIIQHAEEITFLGGLDTEKSILNNHFKNNMQIRLGNALSLIRKSAFDNYLKFQGMLWGGIFVHVPFLQMEGMAESDRIARFRGTESLMLRCGASFTEIMLLSKNIQELSGYANRIYTMFHYLDHDVNVEKKENVIRHVSQDYIKVENLTVYVPGKQEQRRMLFKELNLTVNLGEHLLITGPNGSGKTSLIRTLAGLWKGEEGELWFPTGMMWIPQRPYLVSGTLRDQVTYPFILSSPTESENALIAQCLLDAGLERWVNKGLDTLQEEWNSVFSEGERQRIGFARLYYHKPNFAVVDEATSAINADEEPILYKNVLKNSTVISIAHRLELRKLHKKELRIVGDGTGAWTLTDL